jgi:hypothetical protein
MKRQKPPLVIALILTSTLALAITGCSIAPGAEADPAESVQPLDAAAWPTPQPSAQQSSPTPFPKITLAPTATPTPRPPVTGEAASVPGSASSTEGGLIFTGDVGELVEQVTNLSGGFPPTAAAIVTADAAVVHQGPADSFDSAGTADRGELAAVPMHYR